MSEGDGVGGGGPAAAEGLAAANIVTEDGSGAPVELCDGSAAADVDDDGGIEGGAKEELDDGTKEKGVDRMDVMGGAEADPTICGRSVLVEADDEDEDEDEDGR